MDEMIVRGVDHIGFKVANVEQFVRKVKALFGEESVRVEKEPSGATMIYVQGSTPWQVREDTIYKVQLQCKIAIAVKSNEALIERLEELGIEYDTRRIKTEANAVDFKISHLPFHSVVRE